MNESTCMDHSQAGRGGSEGGGTVREAHGGGGRHRRRPRPPNALERSHQFSPGFALAK